MKIATFGEILLRFSPPGNELPFQTPFFRTFVGGAEANVASQLALLGHDVRMLSAVPDNAFGEGACARLREYGVDTSYVRRLNGRLGLYLVTVGVGMRSSHVTYDRNDTSFQRADPEHWPWDKMLTGVNWLHVSGINAALGPLSEHATRAGINAARERGIFVSFDCNYRENLWRERACDPVPILTDLIARADLLFGNHRDISLLSGRDFLGNGGERRREAAECAFSMFPELEVIASTARHAHDADRHTLAARIDRPDAAFQTEESEITRIVDRIGSGDAFCAGVLHAMIAGHDDAIVARTGLALAALKHTLPGDAALFREADIAALLDGSFDVRR